MIVIALVSSTGPGSGKSSMANYILRKINQAGKKAVIQSYASPVKKIGDRLINQLGLDVSSGKDVIIPGTNTTPRDIYVAVGEEGRRINPYIWIDAFCHNLPNNNIDVVIIDDLRKMNELESLDSRFKRVILINVVNAESPLPHRDSTDLLFNLLPYSGHIVNYPSGKQPPHVIARGTQWEVGVYLDSLIGTF